MTELKPCPFCGRTDGLSLKRICIEPDVLYRHAVICTKCSSSGSKEYTAEKAVERWNKRHYPADVQQAVERMKPKKVIPEKVYFAPKNRGAYFFRFLCPTCKGIANRATNREFCNNNGCGQALDWSEE